MKKRLLGLFGVLVISAFTAISANAAEIDETMYYTESNSRYVFQEGGLDVYESADDTLGAEGLVFDTIAYPNEEELYLDVPQDALSAYIYNAIQNKQTFIDIYSAGFRVTWGTSDQIFAPYYDVVNSYPELFYAKATNASGMGGCVRGYNMSYSNEYDMEAFEAVTEEALACIEPGMTDLEKIIALHDFLVYHCGYDYERYLAGKLGEHPAAYNAYGALVDRQAVCNGYSLAYKYLLTQVGIKSYLVSSSGLKHAWNIVVLDGDYYLVDTTWDDPVWDIIGRVQHTYLMNSEATFGHIPEGIGYDWKITDGSGTLNIHATNTKYDHAFWNTVSSRMVRENGYYYYTAYEGPNVAIRKNPVNTVADQHVNIYTGIRRWTVFNSTSFYTSSYSFLNRVDDKLVFNSPVAIYSIGFDGTNVKELYTPDTSAGYIYGFEIRDKKLNYCIEKSPNRSAASTIYSVSCPELFVPEAIKLDSMQLLLNGQLGMKLYFTVPAEQLETGEVYINIGGEKTAVSSLEKNGNKYCTTIYTAPKEYDTALPVTFLDAHDEVLNFDAGSAKGLAVYNVRISTYLQALLAGDYSEREKNISKAIINYGNYAKSFFKGSDEIAPDASMQTLMNQMTDSALASYKMVTVAEQENAPAYLGMSLVLEDRVKVRMYFSLPGDAEIEDYRFQLDGDTIVPQKVGENYYIESAELYASELMSPLYLQVFKNSEKVAAYGLYGAASYMQQYSEADVMLQKLLKALYVFAEMVNQS